MRAHATLLVLLAVLLPSTAVAQNITAGVIQGTVVDGTGGALPGAAVAIKNLDTNAVENRTTDADGRFVALQLPPGRYTVTVTLQGFSRVVQDGIVLTVGQTVNLMPRLAVSAVPQTVTVTGTPTVETTRSGVAIDAQRDARSRRRPSSAVSSRIS